LGSSKVWDKANAVLQKMSAARHKGVDITADVYPYTYWQSTVRVLIATEEFDNRALWEEGLKDIGGAEHVRIGMFSPEPTWAGKTLAEVAAMTNRDPISIAQEMVRRTKNGAGSENVIVTAMQESDLRTFLRDPNTMICSDGGINGSHPRGAGTFPRILGVYVRQQKVLTLEQAIHKMTQLTAKRMGLKERGVLAPGMAADIVVFDPKRISDTSTVQKPASPAIGMIHVLVNGVFVLENERITGVLPGEGIRK
ncbi:MAG: amidohydrolase family protein, partial [Armatimonadetes bacterium]|nr:amidohydrolase family protein [Armatimonadota bacterium]